MKIAMIGTGYVGLVTGTCLADSGNEVTCVDIDQDKMMDVVGKVVGDFGASLSSMLAFIGQKLGLYEALANADPMTPAELAESIPPAYTEYIGAKLLPLVRQEVAA